MPKKPYYITTAIAYTSGKPHIGNTYEVVLADSIARYKRYVGYDVRFQTGTDEHGQKIEIKAFENLSTPKEFVDETSAEIKRIWDLMNTLTTNSSVQRTIIMRSRYRRFSRNYTIRAISTRVSTKACTVHLVNPSSRKHSLWTANARTVAVRYSRQRKKHISSSSANTLTV